MFIEKFQIQNFKSFQDITIHLNRDVNILTGRNNAGKTTVLEALSLWYECFQKLLTQAKRSQKNYRKDDWVLGPTSNRYFAFDQINSVRSPNFEDIFHDCQRKNKIKLGLTFEATDKTKLDVRFNIGESGNNYIIELERFTVFDFTKFNSFLPGLPDPFSIYYASPIATIAAVEEYKTSPQIEQIFHLDGKAKGEYSPIDRQEIEKLQPHFKGIYPSLINPVIRSIGEITGLDFVNAIECDRLIFVESEDDARVFNILLKQQLGISKRYMFWVLGGISEVFENILAYKTVFSSVENGKNLWEKSCLIIDKDYLNHEHQAAIITKFKEKHQLDVFSCKAYTFESTVFENLEFLATLLSKWIESRDKIVDKNDVLKLLQIEYVKVGQMLEQRYSNDFIKEEAYRYRNIREKTNNLFGDRSVIKQTDIDLPILVRTNLEATLQTNNYYWLMRKEEVTAVIEPVAQKYGLNFNCETDFIEIIKAVTKSTWMSQWDFLNQL